MTSPFRDADRPRAPVLAGAPLTAVGRHGQHALTVIHGHLRDELARVVRVVQEAAVDARRAADARALVQDLARGTDVRALGAFCARYCSVVDVHHRIEDAALFPDLADADASLRPVLERLSEEHVVVHEVLVALDDALVGLVQERDGALERVREQVALLAATLLDHLDYEERELLPALGRLEVRV